MLWGLCHGYDQVRDKSYHCLDSNSYFYCLLLAWMLSSPEAFQDQANPPRSDVEMSKRDYDRDKADGKRGVLDEHRGLV